MGKRDTVLHVTLVVKGDKDTAVGVTWAKLAQWFNQDRPNNESAAPFDDGTLLFYQVRAAPRENIDTQRKPEPDDTELDYHGQRRMPAKHYCECGRERLFLDQLNKVKCRCGRD